MMCKKKYFLSCSVVSILTLFLSGCAGTVTNMATVSPDKAVAVPDQGKSIIVFLRPSGTGYKVQSSVFEIKRDNAVLAGIVAAKKKVSYQLEPGKHLFMVVGESADFMSAELEANKTYYALVEPRMGWWKARFSLKPVHADKLNSSQFNNWVNGCEWVELTPDSENWANKNMPSIQSKYNEYYSDWISKGESDRPKLLVQDGKLSNFSGLEPLKSSDDSFDNYYSPQDSVDSFDNQGEYYSPEE